jgi:protein O-mannosyl-transferase
MLGVWFVFDAVADGLSSVDAQDVCSCDFSGTSFSLHPLRVESVAWIVERRDVLSLFWLGPCVFCYLLSTEHAWDTVRSSMFRLGALAFFCLSLFSKGTAVTLPVVLLLVDYLVLKRFRFSKGQLPDLVQCVKEKIPFFAISLLFGILAILGQSEKGAMMSLDKFSFATRLANACVALVFYVRNWFFPWDLSPVYPPPERGLSMFELHVIACAIWLVLVLGYVLWMSKRRPAIAAAWLSFFVMILPFTGIFQIGYQMAADRYTYLSMIPWTLLVGAGIYQFSYSRVFRVIGAIVIVFVLSALSFQTGRMISVWRNSSTLWNYVLHVVPNECLPLTNYGLALLVDKENHLAKVMTREALRTGANWDLAWYYYGLALSRTGKPNEAMEAYRKAIELNPYLPSAHYELANRLFDQKAFAEATNHYFRAVWLDPKTEHKTHLAVSLYALGKEPMALKYLAQAAMQKDPSAYRAWAMILSNQGNHEGAQSLLTVGYRHTQDKSLIHLSKELEERKGALPKH